MLSIRFSYYSHDCYSLWLVSAYLILASWPLIHWCSLFRSEEVCFSQMLWKARDILFLIHPIPGVTLRAVVPAYSSINRKHQLTQGNDSSTILIRKKIDWRIETTKPPIVATCPYRKYRSSSIFLLNNFMYDFHLFSSDYGCQTCFYLSSLIVLQKLSTPHHKSNPGKNYYPLLYYWSCPAFYFVTFKTKLFLFLCQIQLFANRGQDVPVCKEEKGG